MVWRPRPSRYDSSMDSTPIRNTRYRPATVPPSVPNIGGPCPSLNTAIFAFVPCCSRIPMNFSVIGGGGGGPGGGGGGPEGAATLGPVGRADAGGGGGAF